MEADNHTKSVGIVGAGLSGLMVAALLDRLGYNVKVYEKRQSTIKKEENLNNEAFGATTSAVKRSINLALSHRGISALREAGIADKLLETAIKMPQRVIHNLRGEICFQKYGIGDETLWSVSRQAINNYLMDWNLRKDSKVTIFYGHTLVSVDKTGHCVFSRDPTDYEASKEETVSVKFDLVIGADGAYSAVRENILRQSRINFSRTYIRHGYKELSIPAKIGENGGKEYALSDYQGLHIWPRGEFMLIALPNPDYSFTATLFAPYTGEYGFDSIDISKAETIMKYFSIYFPDVMPLMPSLVRDFQENPVGALVTIKTDPWVCDRVMLIGDAAHAIVPFYGQGMNAGFEDALLFYEMIRQSDGDLTLAAELFSKRRIPATNILADLCVEHYEDMAKNTSSSFYLIFKRFETILQTLFPHRFKSLYRMIQFTRIPYDDAVSKARRNDDFIRGITLAFILSTTSCLGLFSWRLMRKI